MPPSAAAHPPVDFGGHNGFATFIDYLDAFGIPWAVIADGPALRPGSNLTTHLTQRGLPTSAQAPVSDDDFDGWRAHWRLAGVFTLANAFGDDGTKEGEIEVLLESLDLTLYADVKQDASRSKPRAEAMFATRHPRAPASVLDLYERIQEHFRSQ